MDPFESVAARLTDLNISFEVIEHPPASTTAEADSFIAGIDGVRTKSMCFHPNTNTKTIFLATKDVFNFLTVNGFSYQIIDIS